MIVRRTGRPGSAARPVAARVEELEGRVLLATGPLPPAWQPKTPILSTQWTSQVSTVNALPEYPRPQMVRADWQNLNGEWQFARDTTGGADVPIDRNLAESILVPFPVESALSGVNRRESRMWYRRTFGVPAAWTGQRILLNFGAVNWRSTVYVNGVSVGTHFGGYDSFAYDITPHLNGGTNELIVGVYSPADGDGVGQPIGKQRNNPGGIFYTAASGIWQTVWLEPVPAARITRVDTTPDIDNKTVQVVVHGSGIAGQTVQASVLQGGVQVGVGTGSVESPITINLPNPQLWSPDYPFLYDLNVSLVSGSTTVDRVGSYFGMRKISLGMAGGVLRPMLNNQFVFQMGPLDQGYWPDGIYTAPTDAALRFDLEQEKALGYNVVRKHVKVEPARWYYWADKLGLMVWQDMPSMFPTGSPTTAQRQQFELELREIVDEHRSDTSIVMWVPFNEGWGQYDTARIANLVKSWDPSRLVNNASGWNDAGAGDVIDIHQYVGPASPTPTATRAAVLGEFGGLGLKVPGHEWDPSRSFGYEMEPDAATLTSRYVGLIRDVQTLMTSQGLSAAIYTEIADQETEVNGLLTYDRLMKPDVAQVAQVRAVHQGLIAASRAVGLRAEYKLDGNASDSSGNALHGSVAGGTTFGPGHVGSAANFNGTDAYVSIPRPVANDFTLAFWVKTTATGGSGQWWAGKGLVDGEVPNVVNDFGTSLVGNKAAFGVGNPDVTILSTTSINDGQWHHVTATRQSSSGAMRLYVDGKLEASADGPTGSRGAAASLRIGSLQTGLNFVAGSIDQVRIYDYALAPTAVAALADPLPTPWQQQDIGAPGSTGSAGYFAGNWVVRGGGSDIWGTTDQFDFVSRNHDGDGVLTARVDSQQPTDPWAKSGVMFRDGLAADAAFAAVYATPGNGVSFQWRTTAGASAASTTIAGVTAPVRLKLLRAGNTFTAYYSTDESLWLPIGSPRTIVMAAGVRAGLAVTAHNNALLNTTTFSNVLLSGLAGASNGVWDGGGDGANWTDPLNWSNDVLPSAADDAIIDVPGVQNIQVASGAQSIRSLTCQENLAIGGGSLSITQPSVVNGSLTVSGGTLNLGNSLKAAAVNVVTGGQINLTPSGAHVLDASALAIAAASRVDLADNDLIARAGTLGSWSGSTYTGITGLIQSGRNGGGWTGSGIVTSSATGNFTTLGVATAKQAKGLTNDMDTAVWSGQTVTGSDTLVMYTYGGDANLDGKINIDDYGHIDTSVGTGLNGWFNGDFNYDGKINIDDYGIIDVNVGIQGPPLANAAAMAASAPATPSAAVKWVQHPLPEKEAADAAANDLVDLLAC